jgi:hypothetical protein
MCSPVGGFPGKSLIFALPFKRTGVMNRHAPTGRRKGQEKSNDQRRNQHSRYRCGTGRARRTGEGLLEEAGQPEEGRA